MEGISMNYVPPEGSPHMKKWIIGICPGEEEDRLGRPFIGPAGNRMDMAIKDSGNIRSEFYIWNLFHYYPERDKYQKFFTDYKNLIPTPWAQTQIDEVKRRMEEFRPHCIAAMGEIPLYFLTGKRGISKWRGSVLACTMVEGLKVYPMYHPSHVHRLINERGSLAKTKEKLALNIYPTAVKDFRRFAFQGEFPELRRANRRFILPKSVDEAVAWLKEVPNGATIKASLDIEALFEKGANWRPIVTRIGFSYDPSEAISIPFTKRNRLCWTMGDWAILLREISVFLLSGRKFILQNGIYDLTVLGANFGLRIAEGCVLDTQIQQHCAYPYLPKGLDYQTSVYTWEPYFKDEAKSHGSQVTDDALSVYNCKDACVTREIQPITERDIANGGMSQGYARTLECLPALLYMMARGVKFDVEKRQNLLEKLTPKRDEAKEIILQKTGNPNFNPGSWQQLYWLFYIKMGLPMQYTKEGKETTNAAAIIKLKRLTKDPIFDAILDYRKYSKFIGTYVEMEVSEDGRVYTTYDPTGTASWRLASYESPLGLGGNLQNIPLRDEEGKEIRELFIPDTGKLMFRADYGQAEDRYVVWKAGDVEAIRRYERGLDAHWLNAIDIFSLPKDLEYDPNNPEHYTWRNKLSKHAKHAGNYGMGPRTFQTMLDKAGFELSYSECVDILNRQAAATPMIQTWKEWVKEKINTDRTLITALGRKRVFMGRLYSDDTYRKAYAFEAQSTVGELMIMGITKIHKHFDPSECEPLMNVHDEVVGQMENDSHVMERLKAIKELLTIPLQITDIFGRTRELVIPIEFEIGPNWAQTEKVDV